MTPRFTLAGVGRKARADDMEEVLEDTYFEIEIFLPEGWCTLDYHWEERAAIAKGPVQQAEQLWGIQYTQGEHAVSLDNVISARIVTLEPIAYM